MFLDLGVLYPDALPDDPIVWAAMPLWEQVQVIKRLDHHNPHDRKAWGALNEKLFTTEVCCKCGAGSEEWNFTGKRRSGTPDYTCGYCMQMVDVKSPPIKKFGVVLPKVIFISAPAFDGYSAEVLICFKLLVSKSHMLWMGNLQGQLKQYKGDAHRPTHEYKPSVSSLKATPYYKFPTRRLVPLVSLGYKVEGQEERIRF
tara:strand:+ start:694 stop:1293 length:600 start_codon:yes stop_codon:yes gene_type:complete